ncbi:MAG: hypothetical protein P8016_10085 [Sedimentisphaerales bacterium]
MNIKCLRLILVVCVSMVPPTRAGLIYTWSGESSTGNGNDVSVRAEFDITEDGDLQLTLSNISSDDSADPADLLSSFYFHSSTSLTLESASGNVFLTDKDGPDGPSGITDLSSGGGLAYNDGWLFQSFTPSESMPFSFGIGTVGNNGLQDEGFNFPAMDGIESSIYTGDVYTQNLDGYYLVQGSATFLFSGNDITLYDIGDTVAFGFGTAPDSLHFVPLPATIVLGLLGLGVGGWKLRKSI